MTFLLVLSTFFIVPEATQKVDTKCSAKDIEIKVSAYLAKSTERIKISKNKNKDDDRIEI